MPATTVTDAPVAQRVNLAEASPPGTSAVTRSGGQRYRMRIIAIEGRGTEQGIWGSSGYYPASVLERDVPRIFGPTGSGKVFIDHPGIAESEDRPERSVRDLAARITSTPVREADGMYADIEVYEHMAPVIEALWPDIGVSIRAAGLVEAGVAQGRQGAIVTELTAGFSVDFVTAAGAGGKVTQLLESAREAAPAVELSESGSIGAWIESRLHLALTALGDDMYGGGQLTRDERIALSSAVGDALDAFTTRLEADAPALYLRDQWGDPPTMPAGADQWTDPATPDLPVSEADPLREPIRLPVPPSATARAADPGRPDRAQLIEAIRVAAVRDLRPSQIRHLSRAELAESIDPPPAPVAPLATDPGPPSSGTDPAGTPPADPSTEKEPDMSGTQTGAPPDQAGTAPVADTPSASTTAAANQAVIAAMEALTRQVTTLSEANAALAARVDQRETADRVARNRIAAREAVTAALNTDTLPGDLRAQIAPRVTDAVLANVPVTETGDVDTTALTEAINASIAAESGYAAQLLENAGVGRPRGLASAPPKQQTGEEFLTSLEEGFVALGMKPEAAKIAARGRS
jgi:hypothetical protein